MQNRKIRKLSSLSFYMALNVLTISACESDGDNDGEITASEVSFDNDQTELNSTNTQDALIEIATKTDIVDRIKVVEETETSTRADRIEVTCGDQYMAIGGGCKTNAPDSRLYAAELADSGFICSWSDAVQGANYTARAICLSLLP